MKEIRKATSAAFNSKQVQVKQKNEKNQNIPSSPL